jgi:hypothetical protein
MSGSDRQSPGCKVLNSIFEPSLVVWFVVTRASQRVRESKIFLGQRG